MSAIDTTQPIMTSIGVDLKPFHFVQLGPLVEAVEQVYGAGATIRVGQQGCETLTISLLRLDPPSCPFGEMRPLDPVDGEPRVVYLDEMSGWHDADGRPLAWRVAQWASVPAAIVWEAGR